MDIDWLRLMPDSWRIFFRQRQLRPIQESAMLPILRGDSVLLSSPTASGKTEAAFAPIYQRNISFGRAVLSALYIAPTKALVNDMYCRLQEYFASVSPEIIIRRTGDHHDLIDPMGRFVLLSTPEALDSLQLVKPELFLGIRAVIVDELHLLHGTGRGQQLRSVLGRIRRNISKPRDDRDQWQLVGMTATLRDHENVAALWLGTNAKVISAGDSRSIELEILSPSSGAFHDVIANMLHRSDINKVLLFCNSRNSAHETAVALNREMHSRGWRVFLHIGILSASEREHIENEMKRGTRVICVATSTLEVGIDIGDIDLIIMREPPNSISSFLQRIGRGNRRTNRSFVWGWGSDDGQEALYKALLHCAESGEMDDVHEYFRPSVEFQQAMSLAWIGVRQNNPLDRRNWRDRGGESLGAIIEDMVGMGALKEVQGAFVPSDEWMDEGDKRKIHSILVGPSGTPIVDLGSGETIGRAGSIGGRGTAIYAGSRIMQTTGEDGQGIYIGTARVPGAKLAKLPSSRSVRRGLSRRIVWALAEISGADPKRWKKEGNRIQTWGGADYNTLLCEILSMHGVSEPTCDAYSISGLPNDMVFEPAVALDVSEKILAKKRLSIKIARKFRESNRFLANLSTELQNKEALNSIPKEGFIKWLKECL